ncbi:hypothetical protein TEA_008224 [Camellia sinensis var. sinensis]|uniref:non-specific serine/threonine protein kinase n=1 Tax=Camellia sinensis var. sinensis TaxID=542762 RepID=A0A4S4EB02_CAMSN|nr:hypothetical protein TEA_008224 [Camellia sinensis var. sinensis]
MLLVGLSSLDHKLTKDTSFFGLKLWIVILICIVVIILLILVFLCFYCSSRHRPKPSTSNTSSSSNSRAHLTTFRSPIRSNNFHTSTAFSSSSTLDGRLLSSRNNNGLGIEMRIATPEKDLESVGSRYPPHMVSEDMKRRNHCYTLREIESATNGFADQNVIGSGYSGIVYRGVLFDGSRVAVKKLLYDSGKAENFIAQVEAIGWARHKNLVKLLGFCTEGTFRMLVYEYLDNGNLYQWLHGCTRQVSPLSWNIRINIIQAAAKGLAYLHEDVEPKIVHQHIKSTNILLDQQWNPKISDLGVAQVLGPDRTSHATTCSMGMSGYIAPEYASTGVFNEKSDVYSFGILLMEIITGKTPLEYSTETEAEVYLIDWLKSMVAKQNFDHLVDPKMPEMISLKELKRTILIALRCVDPDVKNRPRMGDVIHMFEPCDLLLSDEFCVRHKTCRSNSLKDNEAVAKQGESS